MAADYLNVSKGGLGATHPTMVGHPLLVGPTAENNRNTYRLRLSPIACWRVEDMRFRFDSSFVEPDMKPELATLADLVGRVRKDYPGDPPSALSVFGHADPSGKDDYNQKLSGRRARAVYAMLIRDTNQWEYLYKNPLGGDEWGVPEIQTMLEATGYSPGPIDGVQGNQTTAAVRQFQQDQGLSVDGDAGRATRRELFLTYMDVVCTHKDGSPFSLTPLDFLGNGADAGGKADYQACSEFNPVLVFSTDERKELDKPGNKTKRDEENAPNRRVVAFIFRPGIRVDPAAWPCPSAAAGVGPCKKRFWSDGESRRSNQAERREFKTTKDTFACRFYHRMASESPCEGVAPVVAPWAAQWDRPEVSKEGTAIMRLISPALATGEPVTFQVTQDGYGTIGTAQVTAGAGLAEAPWKDWFHPNRVTYKVTLQPGEAFPPVTFTFVATGGGRSTPSATPLVYRDTLQLDAAYTVDDDSLEAESREYTIFSPWGTRRGKTRTAEGSAGWIIEEALPPGGVSVVLGRWNLL